MSVEDDVARVDAVSEKLVGPRKVWLLVYLQLDVKRPYATATAYTSREAALTAFRCDIEERYQDWGEYEDEEEFKKHIEDVVQKFARDCEYWDGDDERFSIEESLVYS